MIVCLLPALLGLLLAAQASGGEAASLDVSVTAEMLVAVSNTGGAIEHRMVPVATLQEGAEIYYTLHIRNIASVALPDAVVVWPIPKDTHYVDSTAAGPAADISFSVDGGRTFGSASALVIQRNGATRAAATADYTHIRWRLRYPLAPGAIALARFRAIFR